MQLKKFHIGPSELILLALVVVAVAIRFILIRNNWPVTDSDEATIDLMALHIAFRGEHPIFFYGQDYMGAFEAYLGAPLFRLFGASVFTMRLALLPLYVIFLLCMYFITSLLYTKKLALFTTLLLSLGSSDIITHQLMAIGGYPEIMAFGGLIFLISFYLALSLPYHAGMLSRVEQGRRMLLYGLLGLFIGLSVWIDQLILPCVALAFLFLAYFCWRELLRWQGLAGLLGCIVGGMPLIFYNLSAPPSQNSLAILLQLHSNQEQERMAYAITLAQRLANVVALSIPTITGANPCHWLVDVSAAEAARASTGCSIIQSVWGGGVLLLWTVATLCVVGVLLRLWRQRSRTVPRTVFHTGLREWPFDERQLFTRQCARLVLLLSAALTIILFATSSSAALFPLTSSRYLLPLLFATPALLWPLWEIGRRGLMYHVLPATPDNQRIQGRDTSGSWTSGAMRLGLGVRVALVLLIASTFLVGTLSTLSEIPGVEAANVRQADLARHLLQIHATRIYSEYWTCNRLIFQTREHIICAVLNNQLGQGFDRYKPYRYTVRATPHPAYVFPLDAPQAQTFAKMHHSDSHYRRSLFDGYVVYQYKT